MSNNYNVGGTRVGQLITLRFEDREFRAIVIDPHGLGRNQPLVGLGFRGMERYTGIPNNTLVSWTIEGAPSSNVTTLKLPSGIEFRVLMIKGEDGNSYQAIEISDWAKIAGDLIKHPGRTAKTLKNKLVDFLVWFAAKGLYAEAYTVLKGVYSARDSRATSTWLQSRQLGKYHRHLYTDMLQAFGVTGVGYAIWTNTIYRGLFGMDAKEMKQEWELVRGSKRIARNFVTEADGLDAVAFAEEMAYRMCDGDLKDTHNIAINLAKKKFKLLFA